VNALSTSSENARVGCGIAFPIAIDSWGGWQTSAGNQNLDESIRIILGTRLGERVYRPDFGCRLSELAFAPLNTRTLLSVRLYVEEALTTWEPRITLVGVFTEPEPVRQRVDITIAYQPKTSRDRRSLVYPFYLMSA